MIDTILDRYSLRLKNIRQAITKTKVDGLLVTDIHNIRYLTGFSGSSGFAIITRKENFFITDFRYKDQSENEVSGWNIAIEKGNRIKTIELISKKNDIRKLGVESSVSYEFYKKLSHIGIGLHPIEGIVEKIREIKDTHEIKLIREAVRRAETAFLEVKPYIRQGIRERAVALRLEERLKKMGCEHIPFDIIVASGSNSAMPHAKPTEKKLNQGDLVIIDWGGEAGGYFSDMTRTLLMGRDNNISKQKEIYNTVLGANIKAIASIEPGKKTKNIDGVARDFIKKKGFGEYFGHGTGHGVGLEVHEQPRITWNKSRLIKKNMVFTIEPGIYIPGLGGVRIEDMVVVRKKKSGILTSLPKILEIIQN